MFKFALGASVRCRASCRHVRHQIEQLCGTSSATCVPRTQIQLHAPWKADAPACRALTKPWQAESRVERRGGPVPSRFASSSVEEGFSAVALSLKKAWGHLQPWSVGDLAFGLYAP